MSEPGISVSSSGGHEVVVDAQRLAEAATAMRGVQQGTAALSTEVKNALVPQAAFGDVPGGYEAALRLADGVQGHLDALDAMGLSLGDLAARLDAAAMLGQQLDPATRNAGQIPQ
ncbi:hypothetical protein GB931_15795 [Modestobacter sp. I12A-02628]|uniref:Uncharacterized protein n=1 Tax=Goekera deserti TaxID=2497753 RepID=A0A7K3WIZ2_9ACTN|nr:hypothetical protein [Goekera deserti]MPQ99353.1 hypothetical protein [Goekera deserti]NDI50352.1 hypothetical protein [Goekera deserti]NEL55690.1 hypothetical protein [Goekera deserti]